MSLMNTLVRTYLRHWDRELEEIANNCKAVQRSQLESILSSEYTNYFYPGLSKETNYDTFKANFSISNYNDIQSQVIRLKNERTLKCEYFAQSSGTSSGEKKLIPTPESFVRKNHLRGSWYILHTLYNHNPKMSVFKSKNLLIGGSIYDKHKDYLVGDVSGIMINRIPKFFRPWYVPSIKTAVSPDWEAKLKRTAEEAVKEENIALLGGIPTWVLAVSKLALEISGAKNLLELWPRFTAYIHGGVNIDPYIMQFRELIPSDTFRYLEVYNATEGFFAFQDRPQTKGMLLMCASGIFYEFIKYESYKKGLLDAIEISGVEKNVEYVMLISTECGLMRYIQGDVVKFVTLSPYRLIVCGRITEFLNAFGEDLLLSQADKALREVNEQFDVTIVDYTVAPFYITINEKGRHEWYIEFQKPPDDIQSFSLLLDQRIAHYNSNYAQKRIQNLGLETLKIYALPKGAIDSYFNIYGRVGGQSKLQRLRNDRLLADRLSELLK